MTVSVTITPQAPGPLDRRATVIVSVTESGVATPNPKASVAIIVQYAGLGRDEVVWNGVTIRPGFAKRTREVQEVPGTWSLHVAPDRGWPDAPTLWIVPIDPLRVNGTGASPPAIVTPLAWSPEYPDQVPGRRQRPQGWYVRPEI